MDTTQNFAYVNHATFTMIFNLKVKDFKCRWNSGFTIFIPSGNSQEHTYIYLMSKVFSLWTFKNSIIVQYGTSVKVASTFCSSVLCLIPFCILLLHIYKSAMVYFKKGKVLCLASVTGFSSKLVFNLAEHPTLL